MPSRRNARGRDCRRRHRLVVAVPIRRGVGSSRAWSCRGWGNCYRRNRRLFSRRLAERTPPKIWVLHAVLARRAARSIHNIRLSKGSHASLSSSVAHRREGSWRSNAEFSPSSGGILHAHHFSFAARSILNVWFPRGSGTTITSFRTLPLSIATKVCTLSIWK